MDTWAAVVQFANNVYDALASGCCHCPSGDNSAEEVVSWTGGRVSIEEASQTPRVQSQLGDDGAICTPRKPKVPDRMASTPSTACPGTGPR